MMVGKSGRIFVKTMTLFILFLVLENQTERYDGFGMKVCAACVFVLYNTFRVLNRSLGHEVPSTTQ